MAGINRESSLQEEMEGLKGNVVFWKERSAIKMIQIEELELVILKLQEENKKLSASLKQ